MPWPVLVAPRHSTTIKTRHPIPRPGLWRNITRYVGMLLYVCVSVYSPVVYGTVCGCVPRRYLGLLTTEMLSSPKSLFLEYPQSAMFPHPPPPPPHAPAMLRPLPSQTVQDRTSSAITPPRHISDRYRAVLVEYQKVNLEPFREFPSSSRFNLHVHFLP